jgi:glutamate synthase domain-containing protein 2
VKTAAVEVALGCWAAQFCQTRSGLEGITVNNKKVRGASQASEQAVALLSGLSQRLVVVLRRAEIETSEQAEFEELIAALVLTGCVVTIDALQMTAMRRRAWREAALTGSW